MPGEEPKQGGVPPPPEWEGDAPAGWYLDPDEAPLRRYWDGSAWTDDTREERPDRDADPWNRVVTVAVVVILIVGLLAAVVIYLPKG